MSMLRMTDREYLRADQYGDASKLDARIELHRRFSTNKRGWNAWLFEQMELPAEGRVLDLGCGPSHLWIENIDRVPDDWEVTLTDFSPGMLQQTLENLGERCRDFRFGVVDAQAIPFGDGCFDAVIANHMLYHVPDKPRALAEIHRVLKPGGCLYAATNGQAHMRELREWMGRFDPDADVTTNAALEFGLENGEAQLARYFPHVTLHRHENGLVVTEVEPFVAYALSTDRSARLRENLARFTRLAEQEIDAKGAIYITKDAGLFEARKAECVDFERG
jgi:SAM-dependent methyltransferase